MTNPLRFLALAAFLAGGAFTWCLLRGCDDSAAAAGVRDGEPEGV